MIKQRFYCHSFLLIVSTLMVLLITGMVTDSVLASSSSENYLQDEPGVAECLSCHAQPDWVYTLPNGDELNLSMDYNIFRQSVHKDMTCIECHVGYEEFPAPHKKITAKSRDEYQASFHDTCQKCHQEQFSEVSDSIHNMNFQNGNLEAPLCSDCHQPHSQTHIDHLETQRKPGAISWQSQICADCHQVAFEDYKESVHGSGLLLDKNEDMPDCVDCHNVHDVSDPSENNFRKTSVSVCAGCHTDTEIMQKYGLETNVLDTYMVFHGTTITLLEDYNPDTLTNKPTCYDCHGIHEVGEKTPPAIEADISAMTLYPEVEMQHAGPPVEDVGVTGLIVGILIGSVGALTINQLVKERKQDLFEE